MSSPATSNEYGKLVTSQLFPNCAVAIRKSALDQTLQPPNSAIYVEDVKVPATTCSWAASPRSTRACSPLETPCIPGRALRLCSTTRAHRTSPSGNSGRPVPDLIRTSRPGSRARDGRMERKGHSSAGTWETWMAPTSAPRTASKPSGHLSSSRTRWSTCLPARWSAVAGPLTGGPSPEPLPLDDGRRDRVRACAANGGVP